MNETPPRQGPFIALSARFFDEDDIEVLRWDDRAFYIAIACKVRQLGSDGWITEAQVSKLGYPRWRKAIPCLKDAGLLTQHTNAHGQGAYYVPAYLKWNWSEEAWQRKTHEGRVDACKRWHEGPEVCDRAKCRESATWLRAHPKHGLPNGSPTGTPTGSPNATPTPTP